MKRGTRCLLLSLVGLFVGACGSRTSLYECFVQGAKRGCSNACGEGEETCIDGVWTDCDAAFERECVNDCGPGRQRCENGVTDDCDAANWIVCEDLVCEVQGEQWCEDNTPQGPCVTAERVVECRSVCGEGTRTCLNEEWSPCDAPRPKPPQLEVVVRDFRDTHPDFEFGSQEEKRVFDPGIVADQLGPDEKPVYLGNPTTPSTTGRENFDQWYRDVPGVNERDQFTLELAEIPGREGVYAYRNNEFFPIDGKLFGNTAYQDHNYHFTVEIKTRFLYVGGETFSFSGDDDLWVFINGRLALDIGGVHTRMTDSVNLDTEAEHLGIELDEVYDLHLFFAERHTIASNFEIETTIAEWDFCD